jgi:dTDP-4-amino-4,6-dideoxygalactose transaminase
MTIQKPLLRYPIVDKNRDSIILKLKSQRVIPGNWYSGPIHPPETNQQLFDYKEGSCPNAELISQQIINLPTSINTSIEQALHISSIL